MYSPLEPLTVLRVTLVASSVSAKGAPVTAAPLVSVTVPRIRPPVLCACACGTMLSIVSKSGSTPKQTDERERERKSDSRDIINSPLFSGREISIHLRDSSRLLHSPNLTIILQT